MRSVLKVAVLVLLGLGLSGCAWLFTPLQAVLTASPTSGVGSVPVQFDMSVSTGQITAVELTFGDGSPPYRKDDVPSPHLIPVVHTYTNLGPSTVTYTATLTVQDNRGRTDTATVTITVSPPPTTTVSLGAIPASDHAPLEVMFWAHIQAAPGRRIKRLALDQDSNGTAEYEVDVDFTTYNTFLPGGPYTYSTPGDYTATLTVTDDATPPQRFTATATINVTSPPPAISSFSVNDSSSPPIVVSQGAAVTFKFQAQAGDATRKLVKWELQAGNGYVVTTIVPAADTLSVTHLYLTGYAQTGSYTARVKVWDDLNNTAERALAVEVITP